MPDSNKLSNLLEKLKEIEKRYLLLSRGNLSFSELNEFNEQLQSLQVFVSQDLEIIASRS